MTYTTEERKIYNEKYYATNKQRISEILSAKLNVHYVIRCIVKQILQDTSIVISAKRDNQNNKKMN